MTNTIIVDGFLGSFLLTEGYSFASDPDNLMRRIILEMEKTSVSPSPWEVGTWEPGMWEDSPLRKMLKEI